MTFGTTNDNSANDPQTTGLTIANLQSIAHSRPTADPNCNCDGPDTDHTTQHRQRTTTNGPSKFGMNAANVAGGVNTAKPHDNDATYRRDEAHTIATNAAEGASMAHITCVQTSPRQRKTTLSDAKTTNDSNHLTNTTRDNCDNAIFDYFLDEYRYNGLIKTEVILHDKLQTMVIPGTTVFRCVGPVQADSRTVDDALRDAVVSSACHMLMLAFVLFAPPPT